MFKNLPPQGQPKQCKTRYVRINVLKV
jgi:hypothetical protein